MSEPFIGQIKMFAGNFAPRSFALCDGQLLAISQNDALFSLLGVIYGGDGRTTFALPDMRGRIPIHQGRGPGLSERKLGLKTGSENVTLTINQMPNHTHTAMASADPANSDTLAGKVLAKGTEENDKFYVEADGATMQPLINGVVENNGGGQDHTNMMPFQTINFIIALQGLYPSRN